MTGDPVPLVRVRRIHLGRNRCGIFRIGERCSCVRDRRLPGNGTGVVRSHGRKLGRVGEPADYLNPWLATDDRQVVLERIDSNTGVHQIWKLDLARNGNASRLTLSPMGRHPVLSSDGHRMVYVSHDSGHFDYVAQGPATTGTRGRAAQHIGQQLPGRLVARRPPHSVRDARCPDRRDLWVCRSSANESRARSSSRSSTSSRPSCHQTADGLPTSPMRPAGGRCMSGPFLALGISDKISAAGGTQPRWRRDGKEIFYLAGDRTLMAVDLGRVPRFSQARRGHCSGCRLRKWRPYRSEGQNSICGQRPAISRQRDAPRRGSAAVSSRLTGGPCFDRAEGADEPPPRGSWWRSQLRSPTIVDYGTRSSRAR